MSSVTVTATNGDRIQFLDNGDGTVTIQKVNDIGRTPPPPQVIATIDSHSVNTVKSFFTGKQ
ncbi:MAG TPA: hypothetical protein VFC63_20810 [Blastocatellia bacterium]|nr:hypothetical protein [Blastocatellia bacterium]